MKLQSLYIRYLKSMLIRLYTHRCNVTRPLAFLCHVLKIAFINAGQTDVSFLLKIGVFLLKLSLYIQFLPNTWKCGNCLRHLVRCPVFDTVKLCRDLSEEVQGKPWWIVMARLTLLFILCLFSKSR